MVMLITDVPRIGDRAELENDWCVYRTSDIGNISTHWENP